MGNLMLRLEFYSDRLFKRSERIKCKDDTFQPPLKGAQSLDFSVEEDEDLEAKLNEESQNLNSEEVQYIRIRGETVQNLPVNIGMFSRVVSLDVSNNYLVDLPWSTVYMKNLKALNLSQNMLTALPPVVCYLRSLTKLDISHNFITHLPTELLLLQDLTELTTEGNKDFMSPPRKVLSLGIDAVRQELSKRYNRKDLWENWNGRQRELLSLFQLCIICILHCKVEFISPTYVPPKIKAYLSNCVKQKVKEVMVCKCSICHGYFSNKCNFDIHHCK